MQFTTDSYSTSKTPLLLEQGMLLDRVAEQLKTGRVSDAVDELMDDLAACREEEGAQWPELARWYGSHPVRDLLLMDPFTYRAYSKPRGYAGDAVMMDYIYGLGEMPAAMIADWGPARGAGGRSL